MARKKASVRPDDPCFGHYPRGPFAYKRRVFVSSFCADRGDPGPMFGQHNRRLAVILSYLRADTQQQLCNCPALSCVGFLLSSEGPVALFRPPETRTRTQVLGRVSRIRANPSASPSRGWVLRRAATVRSEWNLVQTHAPADDRLSRRSGERSRARTHVRMAESARTIADVRTHGRVRGRGGEDVAAWRRRRRSGTERASEFNSSQLSSLQFCRTLPMLLSLL